MLASERELHHQFNRHPRNQRFVIWYAGPLEVNPGKCFWMEGCCQITYRHLPAYSRSVPHLPDCNLGLKICRTSIAGGRRDSNTFRDCAADEIYFPREIIELALAHTIGSKVETDYRRVYIDASGPGMSNLTVRMSALGSERSSANVRFAPEKGMTGAPVRPYRLASDQTQ
jgi:hypothetical protein